MYEILVTGPLCTSECAGGCRLFANLYKRALDVTADVIVQATSNADIETILTVFSFLNRIWLLLILSSYPIVLTRVDGLRSRPFTSRKIYRV